MCATHSTFKAGKVYYVFATGSKLGFCGFGFLPTGYRDDPNKWTSAGMPNDYGEFSDDVYAKLPKVSDDIYKPGSTGNTRLMGGEVTLDVTKKAGENGSYKSFYDGGFTTSTISTTSTDNSTTTAKPKATSSM